MHWDGAISVGNILTFIGIIGAILIAFNRFTITQAKHTLESTTAINNLAMITDHLEKAVAMQNGRVARLEIAKAVEDQVAARMASLRE